MACMGMNQPQATISKRMGAVRRLDAMLAAGTAQVVISAQGAVAFKGDWNPDKDISDVCAYRALSALNSPSLRRALARAEVTAGRKVDMRAVNSGTHSHDGGKTWGNHNH